MIDDADLVTDVVGIAAVLVAVGLLLRADLTRAAGRVTGTGNGLETSTSRSRPRGTTVVALVVTCFALVVIGGRFALLADEPQDATGAPSTTTAPGDDETGSETGNETVDEPVAPTLGPVTGEDPTSDTPTSVDPAVTAPTPTAPSTVEGPTTAVPPTTAAPPTPTTSTPPARAPPGLDGVAPAAQPTIHTVAPGDNFWSVAESVVGASADESAVATYWQQLIDANEHVLVEPGNPDLLLPGQQLDLVPPGPELPRST